MKFKTFRTAKSTEIVPKNSSSLRSVLFLRLLATAVLLVMLPIFRAQALDPSVRWQALETEHFTVVFDSRHYDLAKMYAEFAEHAFQAVSPVFNEWPRKTVVVLNDETDISNGSATGIPYPIILAYPVLPTSLDEIGDYGNWGLELLTHEYTHILTFEPAHGVMAPFRHIFGSIVRPNILLPVWYLEGLAVEMETRYSKFGRLRSSNYLSIPRAMVEGGTLYSEDIARINELGIPDWPRGARPYLLGAMMWNEVVRLGGDQAVGKLNAAYSRHLPFFIDGPVRSILGFDYRELLQKTYSRAEIKANEQIAQINAASKEQGTAFTQDGFFSHSPIVSPDNKKLAWIGQSHNLPAFVMLSERTDSTVSFLKAKSRRLFDSNAINRIGWFPDSKSFVYDDVNLYKRYYNYSDLWTYDLEKKRRRQLTHGLRAREPVVSPDGKFIVFVQTTPGGTHLSAVTAAGENISEIYTPALQIRVENPEFIGGSTLIFTEKRDDGSEAFKRMHLVEKAGQLVAAEDSAPINVLTQFSPVHFPRLTRKGLLFVSDRSGVANLYLANAKLSDAYAVTNTTTRVMTGEIDPGTDELLYSRLTAKGSMLYASEKGDWTASPAVPPQVGSMVDTAWPEFTPPTTEVKSDATDYSPLSYLWPHYWMPYAFAIPGGAYVSASTAGSDPVGLHNYSLTLAYDTLTNKPSIAGQYLNKTTQVPLTLLGSDTYEYIYSGNFSRHTTAAEGLGSFFLPQFSEKWLAGAGWQYFQSQVPLASPTSSRTLTVVRNGPKVQLSYTNVSQSGLEISPERGGAFSISHTRYLPSLGNTSYDETDLSGSLYLSRWLPERHVLALSTNMTLAPHLHNALLGQTTVGGSYQSTLVNPGILMRGYNSGVFVGRNLLSGTAEYRFPLHYSYRGFGTWPIFLSRWHGALFVDALTLDGLSYDSSLSVNPYRSEKLGKFFIGTGGEVRADTTLFYHLPVQFIFGLYYGTNRRANPAGLIPFLGVSL
jgi:Tol biopolymer transport system component